MKQKEMPELEGEMDGIIADKHTEAMVDIEDRTQVNFWLNLPDVPFNVLMMLHSTTQLRILTQVSSSLKKRITVNILESHEKKKILRDRTKRTIAVGPEFFPSNEDITNAMWLSKIKLMSLIFNVNIFLFFSGNIGILDTEVIMNLVIRVRNEARGRRSSRNPPNLECLICAAFLAHHIQFITSFINLTYVDLSTVPTEHIVSLASSVTRELLIENVTGCDLVTLLDSVNSERLHIKRQRLGREETQALVQAMESRVEKVRLFDVELDMETLTKYSGQGLCKVLDYVTWEMATDPIIDVEKLRTWSEEKTWFNKTYFYYNHNGRKASCMFRQTSAGLSLEDMLEMFRFYDLSAEL